MSAERILVIQLRQLGDTLMSTPVLRELRRLHPPPRSTGCAKDPMPAFSATTRT